MNHFLPLSICNCLYFYFAINSSLFLLNLLKIFKTVSYCYSSFSLIDTFKVHNETELVTPASVGRRVLVANANNEVATTGILRFVGPLEGQHGLFCGVELSEPLGKNDGSYRGMISCSFME